MGANGEQDIILLRVVCGRTTVELCSGCADAEGCVGESEEDFRREHHSQEAPAPTGVEQPTTTRFVGGGLHLKDQGHLCGRVGGRLCGRGITQCSVFGESCTWKM